MAPFEVSNLANRRRCRQMSLLSWVAAWMAAAIALMATPIALFLWRRLMAKKYSGLSAQVRLHIGVWTVLLMSICVHQSYAAFTFSPYAPASYNSRIAFFIGIVYITFSHTSTMTTFFLLADRCLTMWRPGLYGPQERRKLLKTSIWAILLSALFWNIRFFWMDFPVLKDADCPFTSCTLQSSLSCLVVFRLSIQILNLGLASAFVANLIRYKWKRGRGSWSTSFSLHLVALWSVFAEFSLYLVPLYSFLMTFVEENYKPSLPLAYMVVPGTALDGLLTTLIYVRVLIWSRRHHVAVTIYTTTATR